MAKVLLSSLLVFLAFGAFGQAGNYRSLTTGNWHTAATWERDTDLNGSFDESPSTVAPTVPATAGTVVIQSGHIVTVAANVTVDQTTVNGGGELIVGVAGGGTETLTLNAGAGDDLVIDGTISIVPTGVVTVALGRLMRIRNGGVANNSGAFNGAALRLVFDSGSQYFHQHDGTVAHAIPVATWSAGSTTNIVGYTNGGSILPTNLGQTFSNFVWECPGQDVDIDMQGAPSTVGNNFEIRETAGGVLYYNGNTGGGNTTLTVPGNFISSGGIFALYAVGIGGTLTVDGNFDVSGAGYVQIADDVDVSVTVDGDLSITGSGIVDFSASTAITTFNLLGDYTQTGGDALVNGAQVDLTFAGSTIQTFTSTLTPTGNFNYVIQSGATLFIPNGNFITGSGTLDVQAGGTLQVGHTSSTGPFSSSGNIRLTGTKTYASGCFIEFVGSSGQFWGTSFPSGTGVNVIISNTAGVSIAAATPSITVGGDLTFTASPTAGNLTVGAGKTLTLNRAFTPNNSFINVTATSNLAITGTGTFGTLRTTGSTTINNFTLNRSGQTVTLGSDLAIAGIFTQTAGNLDFTGTPRTLTISGNYSQAAGNLVFGSQSVLIIDGSGTVPSTIPLGSSTIGTLTVNRSSTTITTGSLTVQTQLNLTSGTLAGTGAITLSSGANVSRADGIVTKTVTATSYNLTYANSGSISTGNELVTSPATALQNLTSNASNSVSLGVPIQVNGVFSLTGSGDFNANTQGITLMGNFVSSGAGTFTSSTITFGGTTTISGTNPPNLGNLFIASGGTLNFGTGTVNIAGNIDHDNGGTINAGTGTVVFNGTTTITSNTSNIPRFNNITIGAGSSLSLACVAGCGAEPTQYSIEVASAWNSNNAGATFNPAPGTPGSRVVLTGTTQSISTLSAHSFFDLYLNGGSTSLTLSQDLNVTNDLVVNTGTTLNTGTDRTINLGDDFILNGSFVPNLGTVVFNGSSAQNVDQTSGSTTSNFYNIVINKSGGAMNFEKNVSLTNTLGINSATTIDFDGTASTDVFTLLSTSSNTAVVLPVNVGAVLGGTVHAQRYMDGEGLIYRYISSPVGPVSPDVTGPRVFDLQGEIAITGTFTGDSFNGPCSGCAPCTGCTAGSTQSMFRYDETLTSQTINNRYADFPLSANTEQLLPGRGYAVFVRQAASPTTIDLRGRLTSGNVTLPVTYSGATADDGWNLVGNPYASPVDWDLTGSEWTKTNVDVTIYTSDNGGGSLVYATYNSTTNSGTNGGSRYIASGQGFWVRTTGASPSLIVTESAKANQQPTFFRVGDPDNTLRVALSKGVVSDESLIHFGIAGSSSAFDPSIDSYKLINGTAIDFFTISSDNKPLTINAQSGQACGTEVKLGMFGATAGSHRLNFSAMETFTEPLNIYLQDQFTGTSKLITATDNLYDFQVTSDPNSKGSNRFKLVFSAIALNADIDLSTDNVCSGTDAMITLPSSQLNVGYKAMILGNTVSSIVSGTGSGISILIPKENLVAGVNQVTVQASAVSCGPIQVNLTEIVSLEVQSHPVITSVSNGSNCGPGQVHVGASSGTAGALFKWFDAPDAVTPIPGESSAELITPFLNKTKTYYVSAITSAGCEGSRTAVDAVIVNFDPVEITEESGALKSSYTSGNQWFLNGTAIQGATGQTIAPTQSGVYKVETTISGCTTSDERTYVVTAIEETLPMHITMYPNPTSGQVLLEVNSSNAVQARIVTVSGIILHDELNDSASSKKRISFDLQGQADGLYILKVQDGESTYTTRVIKKK